MAAKIDGRMRWRLLVVVVVFAVGGVVALLGLQWTLGLGDFATSPQQFEIALGRRAIVGGGRAVVGFTAFEPPVARLEVRCDKTRAELPLKIGERTGPVCGVYVQLTALLPPKGDQFPAQVWVQIDW